MLRRPAAVLLAVGVALSTGCGTSSHEPPPARPAAPQSAELGWNERTPETGPALVFRVNRLTVTENGWNAAVEIENRTGITWELGTDPLAVTQSFGVMLFETGELDEVERRSSAGALPGLRSVRKFDRPVPPRLPPGRRWRTTISADGTLAAARYLRIVFGPLTADGDPPDGLPGQFVWITDHAYLLR